MAGATGLMQLAAEACSPNACVDIVFVHGFGGHPVETWTSTALGDGLSETVCWPKDILSKDLASARILTFEWTHHGDIVDGNPISNSVKSGCDLIDDHARRLVVELGRWRHAPSQVRQFFSDDDNTDFGHFLAVCPSCEEVVAVTSELITFGFVDQNVRPIIFVAHSLGGLVVKQAFYLSFQSRGNASLRKIWRSTRGFLFLATPHVAAPVVSAALFQKIVTLKDRVSDAEIAEQLETGQYLSRILEDFKKLVQAKGKRLAKIISFYEELPLPGQERPLVSKSKTWLLGYPQIPLHADHLSITKFNSRSNPNYKQVLGALKALFGNHPPHEHLRPPLRQWEEELLKSLRIGDGRRNITRAAQGTCSWILQNKSFKEWLNQPSGFLWLQGMAGSGKTVLSRFLVDELNKYDEDTRTNNLVAYHFFSFTGDMKHRNLSGLLHSLLGQMLVRLPYVLTPDQYLRKREMLGVPGRDWFWEIEELAQHIEAAIHKIAHSYKTILIIDALDEGADEGLTLDYLSRLSRRLGTEAPFHVFISSRDSGIQQAPKVRLREICLHDNNQSDLTRYVEERLQVDSRTRAAALIKNIVDQASGIFLWAKLVIAQLPWTLRPSEEMTYIDLPKDLNQAYKYIAAKINDDSNQAKRSFVRDLLILVAFSFRPLSVKELCIALGYQNTPFDKKCLSWRRGAGPDADAESRRPRKNAAAFVREISWGLLEVDDTSPAAEDDTCNSLESREVYFVHWTVQTWIRQEYLNCSMSAKAIHGEVARLCFRYLTNNDFGALIPKGRESVSLALPFSEYATLYWLKHLHLAGSEGVGPREWFKDLETTVSRNMLDQWINLYNLYSPHGNLFEAGSTTVMHIAAIFDIWLPEQSRCETSSVAIDCQDHAGRTSLSHAAERGHVDVCRSLLEKGADYGLRDSVYGQTPLHWASRYGHAAVVQLLLSAGADVNDVATGSSPLHLACAYGHEETVRLLLDSKADPNLLDAYTGMSALALSAALGFGNIVTLCLDYGATTYRSEESDGWTMLHCAVYNGHVGIVREHLGVLESQGLGSSRINFPSSSWISRVVDGIRRTRRAFDGVCSGDGGAAGAGPFSSICLSSEAAKASGGVWRCQKHGSGSPGDDNPETPDKANKRPRTAPQDQKPQQGYCFACPYYKAYRHLHSVHPCRGPEGWPTIARLKAHLYEKHLRFRCLRCQTLFPTKERLEDHNQAESSCERRDREETDDYDEGFDEDQRKKLARRNLRRTTESNTDAEVWVVIFRILFPKWAGDIPKPFYETDEAALIGHFQNYCERARQADLHFREQLERMAPLADVDGILQLFSSYSQGLVQRFNAARMPDDLRSHALQPTPTLPPALGLEIAPAESRPARARPVHENPPNRSMMPDIDFSFTGTVPTVSREIVSDSGVYAYSYDDDDEYVLGTLPQREQQPQQQPMNNRGYFSPSTTMWQAEQLTSPFYLIDPTYSAPLPTPSAAQLRSQAQEQMGAAGQQPAGLSPPALGPATLMVEARGAPQDIEPQCPTQMNRRKRRASES